MKQKKSPHPNSCVNFEVFLNKCLKNMNYFLLNICMKIYTHHKDFELAVA